MSRVLPISCIVVHYNTPSYIQKCLEYIYLSKYKPKEVILIDNHSKMFPEYTIKKRVNSLSSDVVVRIIKNKRNLGFARAVNQGFEKVSDKSQYILLVNPDLFLTPKCIYRLWKTATMFNADIVGGQPINLLSKKPQLAVTKKPTVINLFVEFTSIKKILGYLGINDYGFWNKDSLRYKSPKRVFSVSGCLMLIKKECFSYLRGFDPRFFLYLEDLDFCVRAQKMGFKVFFDPLARGLHFGGASSYEESPKYKISEKHWRNSKKLFLQKNFSLIGKILIFFTKMDEILIDQKHKFNNLFKLAA